MPCQCERDVYCACLSGACWCLPGACECSARAEACAARANALAAVHVLDRTAMEKEKRRGDSK